MKKAEPGPSALLALACALAGAVIGLAAERAQAATIYTYTGDRYEFAAPPDAGFHTITGSFTLADPIPPNTVQDIAATASSFSFSNGPVTITNMNVFDDSDVFRVTTDAAGKINSWEIFIVTFSPRELSLGQQGGSIRSDSVNGDRATFGYCYGIESGVCVNFYFAVATTSSPGIWSIATDATAVPLPPALPLFAGALGLVGLLARRQLRRV